MDGDNKGINSSLELPFIRYASLSIQVSFCVCIFSIYDLCQGKCSFVEVELCFKVWIVYKHLTQSMTSPSAFFMTITCQVINFFNDQGSI